MYNETITIKISPNNPDILMTHEKPDGSKSKKIVALENLGAVFMKDFKLSTGLLPSGTRFFMGTELDFRIGIETPAMVKSFLVSSYSEKIMLPLPSCLFIFDIRNHLLYDTCVFSLDNSLFKTSGSLYNFPYGNVSSYDGRVCWGSVKRPKITKAMEVVSLISLFLDSTFNGDLFDPGATMHMPSKDHHSFQGVIAYLKDKDSFPINFLNKNNISLANLLKGYSNG